MNRYRVCVYAICKNEEGFVERWMRSACEADRVVVTDTGSTDGTVTRLRAAGAVVFEESIVPWRFDTARNIAMDHVPIDADICVSMDLDEVFEPGWRQKLEAAWGPHHTRARYKFVWSHHADGTPATQYMMEKIHRRHGFRWVHPVHEVLAYRGADADESVLIKGVVLHHHPDATKLRAQYLPLLELSAAENPEDDRTAFWLGREYLQRGQYGSAIEALNRHLSLPSATWDEERAASMRCLAMCYEAQGDPTQAHAWLFRAIAQCPSVREPYLEMARLSYRHGSWPLTYAMSLKGLSITQKTNSYLVEPDSWGHALYDYGAIAAYHLGLYQEAHEWAIKAIELGGANDRLKQNLLLIEQKMREMGA